jgi:hypothetical protein
MKLHTFFFAVLMSLTATAQKIDPGFAQLPYNLLGQDSVGMRTMSPAFLQLEENLFQVAFTPFLITASMEYVSLDNMEQRVTTVYVTATSKKQQKAIQKEFPGKKYVVDTVGFNPMTHPMGMAAVLEDYRGKDTVRYAFRLVPDKSRLPDYSRWLPFVGSDVDSFLLEEQVFYEYSDRDFNRGDRTYSIDTTDEGQLGYRVDYNKDADVILYRELGGEKGNAILFWPYTPNLLGSAREMFRYYFPQFIDGDADYELRVRIQEEGEYTRYFMGTQNKRDGWSYIEELSRQDYLDLLEEVSAG